VASGQTTKQQTRLQSILDKTVDNKKVFGTTVSIYGNNLHFQGAAGNLKSDSKYFIASITKLYTTTLIMQLNADGKLNLNDYISKYLPKDIMHQLHVYKGIDYSDSITIYHLLSQTSGLQDYFLGKQPSGITLHEELTSGVDKHWTFEESIQLAKTMPPAFAPGTPGKALYGDTNFQLLGKIVEGFYGKPIGKIMEEKIFIPLQLNHTYLYSNASDTVPATMYFKDTPLHIPMAMTSFGPDGGIVSTTEDCMLFLKAFFNGSLFPADYLKDMYQWNDVMPPLEYGVGLMRFKLPAIYTMGKKFPPMYGHSGLSGAFAFYIPEKEIWITGTVNQINKPGTSFKLMIQLLMALEQS
jgi:D-alanyl-D-alanine carboxypeptidase